MNQPDKEQKHIPKVSIGMPVFNGAKFIRAALDSLLAQTFTDFELVISDNASTDDTETICREFVSQDCRIRYVRQPVNLGAFGNFFHVLTLAKGQYFMWMAHDDMVSDMNYLAHLVKAIDCGYDYAFPEIDILNHDDGFVVTNVMSIFQYAESTYERAKASLKINSFQIYALFRIDVLKEFIRYLEECVHLQCFNEGLFVHAISTETKGGYIPMARKIYRRHGGNLSASVAPLRLVVDFLRYFGKALRFFLNTGSMPRYQRLKLILLMFGPYTLYASRLLLYPMLQMIKRVVSLRVCKR